MVSKPIHTDKEERKKESEKRQRSIHSPEGPIKRTRKLGRIAHQCTLVPEPSINEGSLDRLDSPVHHVTRRDAVGAGLGIRKRDGGDARCRRFRVDRSVFVQDTAVPVGRVLAQTYVGGDVQRRVERAKLMNR